ncbi:MAG: Flp pilus assembly complex ATPase component, partial [Phycisphaeraceae bacterium]|nr:Flp pilus assembly complex ATPase component [Phycisphaeraceae bacterium]
MSVDRIQAEELRQRVGNELSRQVAEAEQRDGSLIAGEDRMMLAHNIVSRQIDALDTQAMNNGRPLVTELDRQELARAVINDLFALGRIQRYIDDPDISDIVINGYDNVWLTDRRGTKYRGEPVADSDDHLIEIIQTAARRGRSEHRWDPASPRLDLQLPSGDRLNAVAWLANRPAISIRRHDFDINRLKQLIDLGTINEPLHHLLKAMVMARFNVIIAGGTGAGKTTFMRCLINEIPAEERLITVEDSLEVGLHHFADLHPDYVELEARPANVEGVGEVTMNDLAMNALRMNPDRLIVGEVRGDESLTLLLACTQGNDGSLCTVHADSSEGVFGRLQMYLAMTRERFDPAATNMLVAQGIDAIVHVARIAGNRRVVTSVREVTGADRDLVSTNEIFGPDESGRAASRFTFSPARLERLESAGFDRGWLSEPG